MVDGLKCPNATQVTIKDLIECKLGGECSYQFPCWRVNGNILSRGANTCLGRNKTPKSHSESQNLFSKITSFFKKLFKKN
jgi:hypothetical protein